MPHIRTLRPPKYRFVRSRGKKYFTLMSFFTFGRHLEASRLIPDEYIPFSVAIRMKII